MAVRPITAVVPVPRKIRLGDETVLAGEFRISDIVAMQQWLDEQVENPLDNIRDDLDELPTKACRVALREALERAEKWPPVLGTPAGHKLLASEEGMCLVVYLALSRFMPDMTGERAVRLAQVMTPGQYGTLCRIAYGTDTEAEIEQMLGLVDDGPRRTMDWCKAIDEVREASGWTYEYIYTLTLSEFVNVRMGGKAPSRNIPVRDGETFEEVQERIRKIIYDDGD